MKAIRLLSTFLLCASIASSALADDADSLPREYRQHVAPFLRKFCYGCHGERKQMAGMRLDNLAPEISAETGNADLWQEVMDRVNLGQMPPADADVRRPDGQAAAAMTDWAARSLRAYERSSSATGGRGVLRRLNRREYANTVADLLALDRQRVQGLTADLPGEGLVDGFNNIGSGLMMDVSLMEEYLAVARQIAELAIVSDSRRPPIPTRRHRIELETLRQLTDEVRDSRRNPDGAAAVRIEKDHVVVLANQGYGKGFVGPRPIFPGDLVSSEGDYLIRVRAGAFLGDLPGPVWMSVGRGAFNTLGIDVRFEVTAPESAPEVYSARVRLRPQLNADGTVTPFQRDEFPINWSGRPILLGRNGTRGYDPRFDREKTPRLLLDYIELEGPLYDEWPPQSHRTIVFKGESVPLDAAYLEQIFVRLARRAYRRPVTPAEVAAPIRVAAAALSNKTLFADAVRHRLEVVLCSPEFLFLREPVAAGRRPLSDFELASRLSYFLWSSMPDEELFRLAGEGRLKDPSVLTAQVERMLADPKSGEFVHNFTRQWLQLDNVGATQPDNRMYAAYYTGRIEKWSLLESYAFFEEVLRSNRSVLDFLDSDFAMLNEPLARFYGIPGVQGDKLRLVNLPAGSQRGGVLTQSAILVQGADGIRTKPVARGAWVLANLFNDPPNPPPPNAGEVEPNSSGERLTVRERLQRHRTVATCASCHAKIDPFGLGLESYNAVGAWRERQDGENFNARNAPPIDASGEIGEGLAFADSLEFRSALLQMKDRFARGLTEKLMTYALGRTLEYTDREAVTKLVDQLARDDYRLQGMVQEIVASEPFRTK